MDPARFPAPRNRPPRPAAPARCRSGDGPGPGPVRVPAGAGARGSSFGPGHGRGCESPLLRVAVPSHDSDASTASSCPLLGLPPLASALASELRVSQSEPGPDPVGCTVFKLPAGPGSDTVVVLEPFQTTHPLRSESGFRVDVQVGASRRAGTPPLDLLPGPGRLINGAL